MAKAAKKSVAKPAKKPTASPALKAAQKAKAKAAKKPKAAKPAPNKPAAKKAKAKPAALSAGLMAQGKEAHGVRVGGAKPSFEQAAASLSHVLRVPFSRLRENPRNYRQTYDEAAIRELADSIEAEGLLQNLVVFPADAGGNYVVNSGNRRMRALALLLKQKRIDKDYLVHILPKKMDEAEALALAIVENLQRKDVDALEEADGFKRLIDLNWSTAKIAETVGLSQRLIQDRLQLATGLFKAAREALAAKTITIEQARAIVTAPVSQLQDEMLACATRKSQPATAEQLRSMLWSECRSVSCAIFDLKSYTGPFIGKGNDALFADMAQFMELQVAAAEMKAEELRKVWRDVLLHKPEDGYFYMGYYDKQPDPEKGGAMVVISDDGTVAIHEGYISRHAAPGETFKEADSDEEEDDSSGAPGTSREKESEEARLTWAAELARKLAEARAETKRAGDAIQSAASANPHFAFRLAMLGIVTHLRFAFTDVMFDNPPVSALQALADATGQLTLTTDELGNVFDFEPIVETEAALRLWGALVALPDSRVAKLFAQFMIGSYVDETHDDGSLLCKFGKLGVAIFEQAAFDLPASLRDGDDVAEEDDDEIAEALEAEEEAEALAQLAFEEELVAKEGHPSEPALEDEEVA